MCSPKDTLFQGYGSVHIDSSVEKVAIACIGYFNIQWLPVKSKLFNNFSQPSSLRHLVTFSSECMFVIHFTWIKYITIQASRSTPLAYSLAVAFSYYFGSWFMTTKETLARQGDALTSMKLNKTLFNNLSVIDNIISYSISRV